jgi:tetratricopeptide (TPR) repeat protein
VDLVLQGVGEASLPPLRFNPDSDPLFLTHYPNWRVPGLEVVPVGLVFRTIRPGSHVPPVVLAKSALDGEDDPGVPKDYLTSNLIGHFHYMLGATSEASNWPRAWREFRRAQTASPRNDVLFFNLGLILRRNGLYDEALAAFEQSNAINPRHIASREHVRASDETAATRQERDRVRAIERGLGVNGATASDQRRIADLLAARGEAQAALGYRLRAEVLEARD